MKTNAKPIAILFALCMLYLQLSAGLPDVKDQQTTYKEFKLELIFNGEKIFDEDLDFNTRVIVSIKNRENKTEKESPFDISYFIKPEKEIEEPEIDSMLSQKMPLTEMIPTK